MIATTVRTIVRRLPVSPVSSFVACASLLLASLLILPAPASAAVSASVRSACMSDYFAYCAGLEVGSTALRRCMSRAGPRLSQACVSALVAAGEVSSAEVDRRKAAAAGRSTRTAAAKSRPRSATRMVSRTACVQGPARPGARSAMVCRGAATAASNRRARRMVATLR